MKVTTPNLFLLTPWPPPPPATFPGLAGIRANVCAPQKKKYSLKKIEWIFTLFVTDVHSLGSDVSDHIFWEWISSEPDEITLVEWWIFTLLELESSEIHSTNELSSLHRWSELFTRFFKESNRPHIYAAPLKISYVRHCMYSKIILKIKSNIWA